MGRGKSKVSEKQKVSECSDTKDIHDIESREDPPIVYEEEAEATSAAEVDAVEEDAVEEEAVEEDVAEDDAAEEAAASEEAEASEERPDKGRDEPVGKDELKNGANGDEEDAAKSSASEEEEEDDEVWDIIHVIPTAEQKIECRCDHCSEQAVATWATDKHPEDKWSLCEKCQLQDFGGWPDDVEPIERSDDAVIVAARSTTPSNDGATMESIQPIPITTPTTKTTKTFTKTTPVDLPKDDNGTDLQSTKGELAIVDDKRDPQPSEEKYELSAIIPLERLLGSPIKCSDEACNLPACSVWTSSIDPKKWYYCVDCQERDFDGWPPSNELPCDYLQPEHLRAIATKCSKKRKPTMPVITSNCVTPLPNPSLPHKGTAAISQVVSGKTKAPILKVSHAAVARHEKWQADAKKLGVNRIIVKKNEAKKVVFDALYDAFRPMNLNDIYLMLKKMIPPPVLKAALEDMSMGWRDDEAFEGSDDDDNDDTEGVAKVKKSETKEPYSGSLLFKAGRSVSSSLYYVDYTKIKEMGSEERMELAQRVATTKGEREQLTFVLKRMNTKTTQLLKEPTNDELAELLSEFENNGKILAKKVSDARVLTINESHKNKLKRRIQSMAGHYRKRKQLCGSFLSSLEEVSDGTVSKKKCLKGDGQIALDSDECVNKAAIAYAKSKKRLKTNKVMLADENFVGVALDSQRMVKRVYVDEE